MKNILLSFFAITTFGCSTNLVSSYEENQSLEYQLLMNDVLSKKCYDQDLKECDIEIPNTDVQMAFFYFLLDWSEFIDKDEFKNFKDFFEFASGKTVSELFEKGMKNQNFFNDNLVFWNDCIVEFSTDASINGDYLTKIKTSNTYDDGKYIFINMPMNDLNSLNFNDLVWYQVISVKKENGQVKGYNVDSHYYWLENYSFLGKDFMHYNFFDHYGITRSSYALRDITNFRGV